MLKMAEEGASRILKKKVHDNVDSDVVDDDDGQFNV